jgi:F0F1-type ATP synthase membrane subunit c/vacuolar-type H+-ATPase subunit K
MVHWKHLNVRNIEMAYPGSAMRRWRQPRRYLHAAFGQLRTPGLYRRDVPITTAQDAIRWWEARRVAFNLLVGSAGIFTCIVIGIVAAASWALFNRDLRPDPPLFALVLLYAVLANICFTGGCITELLLRKAWPRKADRFATSTFSLGLLFSVLLTLSPGIVLVAAGISRLLRHL